MAKIYEKNEIDQTLLGKTGRKKQKPVLYIGECTRAFLRNARESMISKVAPGSL
jgi:hypothetical protein